MATIQTSGKKYFSPVKSFSLTICNIRPGLAFTVKRGKLEEKGPQARPSIAVKEKKVEILKYYIWGNKQSNLRPPSYTKQERLRSGGSPYAKLTLN